jgi:hypothetical protein
MGDLSLSLNSLAPNQNSPTGAEDNEAEVGAQAERKSRVSIVRYGVESQTSANAD